MNYRKQKLNIPANWEIKRHEFYDIDPHGDSEADNKEVFLFNQENLLWLKKGNYNIDLGWYGGEQLKNRNTGFCIHLYRGDSWNKCDLLEIFRTRNKQDVIDRLYELIELTDQGEYDNLVGYQINEDDLTNQNSMIDYESYSARK